MATKNVLVCHSAGCMLGLGIVAAAAQRSQQPAQSAVTVHGLILMAPGYVPDCPYPNPNPRTLALTLEP